MLPKSINSYPAEIGEFPPQDDFHLKQKDSG